jgi:hypothetical protein
LSDPFDYLESRDDADELIADFGGPAAVTKQVTTGPAWDQTLTPVAYATFAVRVEFTWKQLQGDSVLATDQRWLVAAGPLALQGVTSVTAPDSVTVGGVDYPVVKADPLQPAGTVVMFDCQCRV